MHQKTKHSEKAKKNKQQTKKMPKSTFACPGPPNFQTAFKHSAENSDSLDSVINNAQQIAHSLFQVLQKCLVREIYCVKLESLPIVHGPVSSALYTQ